MVPNPQLTKRIEGILRRKKELEAHDLSVYVKRVDEQVHRTTLHCTYT